MKCSDRPMFWFRRQQAKRADALHSHCSVARVREAEPAGAESQERQCCIVPCYHSRAGRQGGREHQAVNVGIKHRAHCLTCGGAALFFFHLRIPGLEVNGAAWLSERAPIAQSGSAILFR